MKPSAASARARAFPTPALHAVALAFALSLAPSPALAQTHPAAPATTAAPSAPSAALDPGAPDSPRASMQRFLDLARAGEFTEAAQYLDVPDEKKAEAPNLARQLKAVLDRDLWIRLEDLSPRSNGDPSDKLAAGVEELGQIKVRGVSDPVRIVRRTFPDGARWIFLRTTVDKIPDWYAHLSDRWIQDHLPEALLLDGPRGVVRWQWIALPLLFALALLVGKPLAYLTQRVLVGLARRTTARWDERLATRLGPPLNLGWALLAFYLALPWIGLFPPAEAFIGSVLRAGVLTLLFWSGLRTIDVARDTILDLPATKTNAQSRSLVPLGSRMLKVAVFAMAVIGVLSQLGYQVESLITGLGVGGVAVALAAQKTFENVFGSLAIGIDQPFRVGDFVHVDTVTGTVETIGLRSTRIRTLDRTLVTLPNGKLADMRVESYAQRDRIRYLGALNLERGATTAQIREVLESARSLLRNHPRAWPDASVALVKLGESSLEIEVSVSFQTVDYDEFMRLREEVLLSLLEIVERSGARLAYPTRSLHLSGAGSELFSLPAAPAGGEKKA